MAPMKGRISIDVEDASLNFGVHGGPPYQGQQQPLQWSEENVREEMISHSVHFPFEPQSVIWPGDNTVPTTSHVPTASSTQKSPISNDDPFLSYALSDFEVPPKYNGVVRALRILPSKCRVLDSASRCPFLVRMEVMETGLDADDASLYACACNTHSGGSSVGLTVQEALGSVRGQDGVCGTEGFAPCEIPPELMQRHQNEGGLKKGRDSTNFSPRAGQTSITPYNDRSDAAGKTSTNNKAVLSRGGTGYRESSPPLEHYEELDHELRHQQENGFMSLDSPNAAAR